MPGFDERLSQEKNIGPCSTVYEPGEGEHKVMSRLLRIGLRIVRRMVRRMDQQPMSYTVLDADLILLTLYNARFLHDRVAPFILLREDEKEMSDKSLWTRHYRVCV